MAEELAGAPDDLRPLLGAVARKVFGSETPPSAPADEAARAEESAWAAGTLRDAERPAALVGPGVLGTAALEGLRALAGSADLGVLNTWGAKGVFDWESRHHWATVGLQAWDLRLGGLGDADVVLTSGLDRDELPEDPSDAGGAEVVDVPPEALRVLARHWRRPPVERPVPPLRTRLAAVTQRGWERSSGPLPPTAVTRTCADCLGADGLVAAEPGWCGFWVARTFPTRRPRQALVPSEPRWPGYSVAAALLARRRRPARKVLALLDGTPGPVHRSLLELADHWGVPVAVECWDPDGPTLDRDEHRARLEGALRADASSLLPLRTDPGQLEEMVEVAGPVTAWGGLE